MVTARVLVKHSASACNKKLLGFISDNLDSIKKRMDLKVLIVYDKDIAKLGGVIKKLPAMVIGGTVVTGNKSIIRKLTSSGKKKSDGKESSNSLEEFWNAEMMSGVDNPRNNGPMDDVLNKASSRSMEHNEAVTRVRKRSPTLTGDNVKAPAFGADNPSEMTNDPIMAKFWENQEETPMP